MFAQILSSSLTWGEPQICAGVRTLVLPSWTTSPTASRRCVLRSVGLALPYSPVRLRKPFSPSGRPKLPAMLYISPSPGIVPSSKRAPVRDIMFPPVLISMAPPERSFLRMKFITPAMASEPYWAAAPSRSTSACSSANPGIIARSGPCDPSARPLPYQVMTAVRWRRLPFSRISVWSGARPRRLAGRAKVAASLMGWMFTLNDGTTLRSRLAKSLSPWLTISALGITSMGTADSVTVRGRARVPMATMPPSAMASSLRITSSCVACPAVTVTSCRSAA